MSFLRYPNVIKTLSVISLATLASVALSSCGNNKQANINSTNVQIQSPTELQVIETESPATSTLKGVPIDFGCADLLTDQLLYDFNPNFSYEPNEKLSDLTDRQLTESLNGIQCVYTNLSSKESLYVSVSSLTPESVTEETRSLAESPGATGSLLPNNSQGASFEIIDDSGVATVLYNNYLIKIRSKTVASTSDANLLLGPFSNYLDTKP